MKCKITRRKIKGSNQVVWDVEGDREEDCGTFFSKKYATNFIKKRSHY